MPIAIDCHSRKSRLQAPESAAGKTVKCPKCQTSLPVPAAGAPAKGHFNFDEPEERPAKKAVAPAKKPAAQKNVQFFEASSMRELYDCMDTWQESNRKRFFT